MKKVIFVCIFLLFIFSPVYSEEEYSNNKVELHTLEHVAETDFDGVWIPFMQYLRPFNDAVVIDKSYINDFILVSKKQIIINLLGNTYTKLPYKFEKDAIYSALFFGTEAPIYISMKLLSKDTLLYTLFFDGYVQAEFFCSKKFLN